MKPRHRVMCADCGRLKMVFDSEAKALRFIRWNGGDVPRKGDGNLRPYYCPACCAWHISSKPHREFYDHMTERRIKAYRRIRK